MKIAFLDFIKWDYTIETANHKALGGSQSAICYLAERLALQGIEVFLFNNTSVPVISKNVICIPINQVAKSLLNSLDALIISNATGSGTIWHSLLEETTPLILWTGHADDQPHIKSLENQEERDIYEGFAFVSHWQCDRFQEHFGINSSRTKILLNAISPAFEDLFAQNEAILPHKSTPPVLAYTSTPYRGLEILLEVFPQIRQAIPGTKLKVFSSMKVYNYDENKDREKYGWLYRQCQALEGVEYIGSIPQPQLAEQLKSVSIFAYPNTFPETSCIAAMEAMASGCYTITSALGALPETCAGFARLIPMEGYWEDYKQRFVEETVAVLKQFSAPDTTELENHLRRQVDFVNHTYTWSIRTQAWLEWLSRLKARKCFLKAEYSRAVNYYQRAIAALPEQISNYWHLGLSLLLEGDELAAQTTWMSLMLDDDREKTEARQKELLAVLEAERKRRASIGDRETLALLSTYIQELN